MRILIVEDDPQLGRNIEAALQAENMQVTSAYDGIIAEKLLKREQFDCIILDLNLPGKSGYEICKNFRLADKQTAVLILTAFDELEDKIKGFELGADDYLTKPFYMRELLFRVNALIRRATTIRDPQTEMLSFDDFSLNLVTKTVRRQGCDIALTPREFQILSKLLERPGEIVSKQELIGEIWGKFFDSNTNTIEVYINFLRGKIDKPFGKNTIKTRVGFGYYLQA